MMMKKIMLVISDHLHQANATSVNKQHLTPLFPMQNLLSLCSYMDFQLIFIQTKKSPTAYSHTACNEDVHCLFDLNQCLKKNSTCILSVCVSENSDLGIFTNDATKFMKDNPLSA